MLETGTTIDRYTVIRTIGEGGMASVYLVQHNQLGTLQALKVLHVAKQSIAERLLQEGRVQASLRHPNVVAVHDVLLWRDMPGLLMELIEGPSLDIVLRKSSLTYPQVDAIARGVLAGVQAAHALGWVHRDIKPANVMLQPLDDRLIPKVTDFGLAKLLDTESAQGRTRTGMTMGTPGYMSPEQIRDSGKVDARADVFSLGCLLYELLAGQGPFTGTDTFDTFQRITAGTFAPLDALRPDTPPRMIEAITAALQVNPADRPENAGALLARWAADEPLPTQVFTTAEIDHLRRLAPDQSLPSLMPVSSEAHTSLPSGITSVDWYTKIDESSASSMADRADASPRSRRRALGGVLLASALIAGAVAAWSYARHNTPAGDLRWSPQGLVAVAATAPRFATRGQMLLEDIEEQAAILDDALDPSGDGWRGLTVESRDDASWLVRRNAAGLLVAQARVEAVADGLIVHHHSVYGHPARADALDAPHLTAGVFQHALRFNDDGQLSEVRYRGLDGQPARGADASYGLKLAYDARGRETSRMTLSADGAPTPDRDGVVTTRFSYRGDDERPATINYFGLADTAVAGPHAVSVELRHYDARGRLVRREGRRVAAAGASDQPAALMPSGCVALATTWTDNGDWAPNSAETTARTTCLNADGEPAWSRFSAAAWQQSLDPAGRRVSEAWFAPDGALTNLVAGYARADYTVSPIGQTLHYGPYFDADGAAVAHERHQAARVRVTINELGLPQLEVFEGFDGQPASHTDGQAMLRYRYDAAGAMVGRAYLDEAGQPIMHQRGFASESVTRDARGNAVEIAFTDAQGLSVPDRTGSATIRQAFNERDELLLRAYFGVDEQPVIDRQIGAHEERYERDEHGEKSSLKRFGPDKQPIDGDAGWHHQRYRYDARGNVVETTQFDVHGRAVPLPPLGAVTYREHYDAAGRVVALEGLDASGVPMPGCTKLAYDYDTLGQTTRTTCTDGSGRLVIIPSIDQYGLQSAFDALGRVTRVQFLGADGAPLTRRGQVSQQVLRYESAQRQWSEMRVLDGEDQPVSYGGRARITSTYDSFDRKIESASYGTDDALVGPDVTPCARRTYAYAQFHDIAEQRCYDAQNQPSSGYPYRTTWSYDAQRRDRGQTYYDATDALVDGPEGWAKRTTDYNANGAKIGESWRRADGTCGKHDGLVCGWRIDVDHRGRTVGWTWIGADNAPVMPPTVGYARAANTLDGQGRIVEERYFDQADQPTLVDGAYHTVTRGWDAFGHEVEAAWWGLHGEPRVGPRGVARELRRYLSGDRLLEHFGYDAVGQPALLPEGYTSRVVSYDARGDIITDERR